MLPNALGPVVEKMAKPLRKFFEFNTVVDADGNKQYFMNPTKAYIVFRSYVLSRAFTTGERVVDSPDIGSAVIDIFSGIKPREFDMDVQEQRSLQNRIKRLEQTLINRGQLKRFSRAFQPASQRERGR